MRRLGPGDSVDETPGFDSCGAVKMCFGPRCCWVCVGGDILPASVVENERRSIESPAVVCHVFTGA